MQNQIDELKRSIIAIGRLLWEKNLVSGLNGNISLRFQDDKILLTGTKTCLGLLNENDIVLMKLNGEVLENGKASSEKILHTEIYKNFPEIKAVLHTHTNYVNGFFIAKDVFEPQIFESKIYLGKVHSVKQNTPNVADAAPVIEELKKNNIVALRNHGVLAMGKELFDCFCLIQALEDAVKVEVVSRIFSDSFAGAQARQCSVFSGQLSDQKNHSAHSESLKTEPTTDHRPLDTYSLFSQEQINEIVKLVNADPQLQELGKKTGMTMSLAVKMEESGKVFSFGFQNGKIINVGNDDSVEFLITAPEKIWRAVFNRELDPFVATTQKKMNLQGDFARISKWYAPCSRLFELWAKVPVA